jgi:1,4-alpha-glucan branching enzyme
MVTVDGTKVCFKFYRPTAQNVHVVGDFNLWRDGELPMRREADGYWGALLYLPPGDYKFRYRADGQWFTDYAAFGIEYGPFGADGVIRVIDELPMRKVKVSPAQLAPVRGRTAWSQASPRPSRKRIAGGKSTRVA